MRYLANILDSDSYMYATRKAFKRFYEAKRWATRYFLDATDDGNNIGKLEWGWKEGEQIYRGTMEVDEDMWSVAEIIEVRGDGNYVVVWHHAFEGVDFKTLSNAVSYEKAKEVFDTARQNLVNCYGDDDIDIKDGFCCIDTGNEWEVIEIVELN